jgi:hypothetical protein
MRYAIRDAAYCIAMVVALVNSAPEVDAGEPFFGQMV